MLPNLTGSIDYWHIALFGLIGPIPANVIFNGCIDSGNPIDCALIVRNPVTGALTGATVAGGGYILQTSINAGTGLTSGIDVQLAYRQGLGSFGTLIAQLNGSYLEHSIATPYPGALSYDCAGLFGATCNTNSVNPNWRHNFRLNWETPWRKLLISAGWRFLGATTFDNNNANPTLMFAEEGVYDLTQPRIPNYSYFDFTVLWPVWRDVEIAAGINNAFDKSPPIIGTEVTGTGAPNTYPTYDILGREVFFSFTAKF
jgi:outer membrane receptor protein involved in Fe transport